MKRFVFVTGHPEYDPEVSSQEFIETWRSNLAPKFSEYFSRCMILSLLWLMAGSWTFIVHKWLNYYFINNTPMI